VRIMITLLLSGWIGVMEIRRGKLFYKRGRSELITCFPP
jgi:hypothetical protein